MDQRLFVWACIEPKPEHFDDARDAIASIVSPTRKEAGCYRFDLLCGEGDGCLYLYEEWTDESALAEHYAQAYTRTVFEKYKEWLAKPVEIKRLRALS
ncbi:MAG: putative quinol monooxygenase [Pseudomonadota bacterium]